jgi:phenylpyruvate tautomerase PptA (4-oxalocrotonate tautomerase family)
MPIVDIHYVCSKGAPSDPPSAQQLADTLGRVFDSPPGRTWVRLHLLPREHYAENDVTLDDAALPVFVIVLLARRPTADVFAVQTRAITQSVAGCFGRRAERIHVEYASPASGRLAFGGRLVE